jgi:16S rRNA pseudouridine516 synthase
MIRKGRVLVNGTVVKKPECKLTETANGIQEQVTVDTKPISYAKYVYYMLNKPAGYLSATEDKSCKTVLELVPKHNGLFPVGRLDKDTEGLCLITNDGELAHNLLSPKKHVAKCYVAKVTGELTQAHVKAFADGIAIHDKSKNEAMVTLKPAKLTLIQTEGDEKEARVTIVEGKYHQIKRMFAAVGCRVTYLKRLSMGGIYLDEALQPGEFRPLTEEEIQVLQNASK